MKLGQRLEAMYMRGWRAYQLVDWNEERMEYLSQFVEIQLDEKYGIFYVKDKYETQDRIQTSEQGDLQEVV